MLNVSMMGWTGIWLSCDTYIYVNFMFQVKNKLYSPHPWHAVDYHRKWVRLCI